MQRRVVLSLQQHARSAHQHLSRKKIREILPPLSRRGGATQFTVHSGSPRPASKPGDLSSPLTPFTNKAALGLQRARCFPPPSLPEAVRPSHCSPETPPQGGSPGLPAPRLTLHLPRVVWLAELSEGLPARPNSTTPSAGVLPTAPPQQRASAALLNPPGP